MKTKRDFKANAGMVRVHDGVVCAWSRKDERKVLALEVEPDLAKIEEIRQEFLQSPGIFDIVIEALAGRFEPGDDLL